jgi:ABC-2 type transport system permease protein
MSAIGVTSRGVVRSEWIKLGTLRSTTITFVVAVAAMIGISVLAAWATVGNWETMSPGDRRSVAVEEIVLSGRVLAQLAVGVLGVMAITGEYATGMIRATLAAVPRRLPVLWAKLGIYAAVTFALMLVASFAGFFAGNAVLSEHWDFHLSDPGVLRCVFGAAISLTLICLLGTALGFIVRNTAGAISILFAILMVVPLVGELWPALYRYLPTSAMDSLLTARIEGDMLLQPLPAFLLLCAYVGTATGGAVLTLLRKDA